MEEEKVLICDKCKDRRGRYKCIICNKDLCSNCNERININLSKEKYSSPYPTGENQNQKIILSSVDCCNMCNVNITRIKRIGKIPEKLLDELKENLKNLLVLNELELNGEINREIKKK